MGGARSEEADRTGRISESKTWLPSSAPGTVGQGAGRGRGRDRVAVGLDSHLRPPGLALAGSQRPVPPSWPRLLSSSLPGHTARTGAAELLRGPPRPTVERGGRAREWSMRSGRAAARRARCRRRPRSQSRCSSPQKYAALSLFHLGSPPVVFPGSAFPIPLKPTLPTLELSCEFSLGHVAMSFPNPSAVLWIG